MTSIRLQRAQGEDLDGKTIRSRTGNVDTDMLSALEGAMVAKQLAEDLKAAPPTKAAEPMEDPNATGSKVAHHGRHGAPSIYREAPGGRRGMRGKRRGAAEQP